MAAPIRGRLTEDQLRKAISDGEIETIITALPDLYGRLVGKRITGDFFLDETAGGAMHVCDYLLACDMEMDPTPGYAFTNWEQGYGDLRAVPDFATLRVADWLDRTAIVLCDALEERSDARIAVAPRSVLRHQIDRLAERGFSAMMASELEFYLFDDDYAAAHAKGYRGLAKSQKYIEDYHVLSSSFAEPVIGAIRRHVDASGIPVEFSKGEWGPGQHEINLRYAEALEMADRHVVYKLAAKEIAAQHDKSVTFMAKWDERLAGSSMHVHMSLWNADGEPAFAGDHPLKGTPVTASQEFKWFLGGLLDHSQDLAWFFAPNVNSYKRFRPGTFAPTGIAWSYDNRTAGFRVVGEGASVRIECRIPGADANPYLAYAALLAAGLDGIEHQRDPGPAFEGDVYAAEDLRQIPTSLAEAAQALGASQLARAAMGNAVIDHYHHFARSELAAVEAVVSDVERARYFERV